MAKLKDLLLLLFVVPVHDETAAAAQEKVHARTYEDLYYTAFHYGVNKMELATRRQPKTFRHISVRAVRLELNT